MRDRVAECTQGSREVHQVASAHVNDDRADLFRRRRMLMEQWADYLPATA